MDIWIYGYIDTRYMDIRIYGYMDIYVGMSEVCRHAARVPHMSFS